MLRELWWVVRMTLKVAPTPNIDRLANEGAFFTNRGGR